MIGDMRHVSVFLAAALWITTTAAQAPLPAATYHLYLMGHEIGRETDTWTQIDGRRHLDAVFHFDDRGTPIDLAASMECSGDGSPLHLLVKGRNYRLFASDSEVTIADGHAHVRDLKAERDIDVGAKPFFPIDNYAPIGVQQELINYWLSHAEPAEIEAAPAGPVRIARTNREIQHIDCDLPCHSGPREFQELSIDGVVWGRETAIVDQDGRLVTLATWAGALPFEAMADGSMHFLSDVILGSAKRRVDDLKRLTAATVAAREGTFALVGARVIDGTDRPPIENATVVIRDGRIAAVGPSASTPTPRGVSVVDVMGKTIIAGLWDMHAHAGQTDWAPVYLASGVTTIRDMGGEEGFLVAIRDAIASGAALGPRYLLAGLIDGPGPRAFGMVSAFTADEAIAIVRRYHDEHFQQIKVYVETPPALVPIIAVEAHRLGMTVTGHVPTGMTAQSVVEAGFDGIAHMQLRGQSGSDQSKQQIAFFKAHGTVMDPTQSWNELSGHAASTPLEQILPGVSRLPLPLTRMFTSMAGGNGASQVASLKLLNDARDAGLLVVAGTDKGVPGFSLQREIELYVDGGMTPLQALQAATIVPARAMKLDKELSTIEVGKRADLVVLESNPLDRIANIRTAVQVVANGKL